MHITGFEKIPSFPHYPRPLSPEGVPPSPTNAKMSINPAMLTKTDKLLQLK
ncbi:hypothetical protein COO91_08596 [Nostoc flagelliforme CCNUN1]|uniref:Uncharacterized protein n=1 Tax=Nostoc flagelliforme CCNUN1 TaxID=2038116 RepID=A0A2K8T436_9NOSO|nr:hypothetical protein COO91_08596 [Nostoc flagelliforme CCNUN1]